MNKEAFAYLVARMMIEKGFDYEEIAMFFRGEICLVELKATDPDEVWLTLSYDLRVKS